MFRFQKVADVDRLALDTPLRGPVHLVLYHNLLHDGARRADTDADGEVDLTDMATFINAYDAATGP